MDPQTSQTQPAQNSPTVSSQPTSTNGEPTKYKVFQSIREVCSSIAKNPLSTLLPLGLSIVAGLIIGVLTAAAVAALNPTMSSFPIIVAISITSFIVQIIVTTSLTNAFALALRGSYDGEQKPVSTYLSEGLRLFGRAFVATILTCLAVLSGFLVMFVASIISFQYAPLPQAVNVLFFILMLASFAWVIIALLRFALSVQVAIFEPQTPLSKVLSRSNHLMVGGGQWFMVKMFVLTLVVVILLTAVTGNNMNTLDSNSRQEMNPLGTLAISLLTPIIYGVATMLYRNRAAVRK